MRSSAGGTLSRCASMRYVPTDDRNLVQVTPTLFYEKLEPAPASAWHWALPAAHTVQFFLDLLNH